MRNDDLQYEFEKDGINEIIDEASGTNAYIALRNVRWNPSTKYKLDLRKYFVRSDGTEVPSKGISFITDQGPDNLVKAMVDCGYGDTREIIDSIKNRPDFVDALVYSVGAIDEVKKLTPATDMLNKILGSDGGDNDSNG